jgi:peptide/nickel transport system substrate-binding protein
MTLSRRRLAQATALLALPGLGLDTFAQRAKDTLVLGMVLEPSPGLDPTTGAAAAIGEVVIRYFLK